jgi:predicted acetyltransferase
LSALADIQIREVPPDRLEEFLLPIATALGFVGNAEGREGLLRIPEFDVRLGAWDGDRVVGAAGSFSVDLTVPGGPVPTAALTMVGVHATHRRRGILRELMRRHLDDARAKGQVLAALWATESSIYARFGYGMASLSAEIALERDRAQLVDDPAPVGRVHLVDEKDARELCRPVWEAVRRTYPGMLSRSREWWEVRRLADPEYSRRGAGALQRAVLELDGQPAAYALYRQNVEWDHGIPNGTLDVREAIGISPVATLEIWRYLFGIDLTTTIEAHLLPIDHPLLFLVAEPGRLRLRLKDALWLRLVDVEEALHKRTFHEGGGVVLDVHDAFCPWNEGRFRITEESARKTDYEPDIRIGAGELGSVYLGGFTFATLHAAGRIEELRAGGVERADQLFRVDRAPWCPEIF